MKQASIVQLKASLLSDVQVISKEELMRKGPKNIMDQLQYSLSDDDDHYDESINFRYAKIVQMDKVKTTGNNLLTAQFGSNRQSMYGCFSRQLSHQKPRSNSPGKRQSIIIDDESLADQEQDRNTFQSVNIQQRKKKPTIKKAQTQEESMISLMTESTPKNKTGNNESRVSNLRNTVQKYVEDSNELSISLNDIVNFRIRAQSYEERTCLFSYVTNLNQSFRRAYEFKREHITLKELVKIMIEFLERSTMQLKNGECKQLLDKVIDSEKVFKKYSQLFNSNQKMSEIDNSPDNRHRMTHQIRFNSNPNVSITKESSSNSLNTPQTGSKAQKSRFYQQEDIESQSQRTVQTKSQTRIAYEIELQDKLCKAGINVSAQSVQAAAANMADENNYLFKAKQMSQESINSSPYTNKITPTQIQRYPDERRISQEMSSSSPYQSLFKRRSISIASYQTQIQKEEDIMKLRQHQKLRLFTHKRTTSFDPNQTDGTPLSLDQSPLSTYSIGGMSPFVNSPNSSNSSGNNQKGQKDEQFNVTVLYQKVNENIDQNDKQYQDVIYILRNVRKLENENIMMTNKAKRLYFNIKKDILDSDDNFLQKRQFLLHKFFIWKMKRWYTQYKRQKTESKKISLFVNQYMEKQVCRICDQKVFLKHFKFHSQLCKEREELRKDLKINMKNINTEMFYFLQKSRSLGVKCQLLQKKIEKIQKLQESNIGKQLQIMRRKSFQTFTDDKINKSITEMNGQLTRARNNSNSFKEYLTNQKQKNGLAFPSDTKLIIDKRNSRPSLTHQAQQEMSCLKISEDDDDSLSSNSSSSSENSAEEQGDYEIKQHSLIQFDKDVTNKRSSVGRRGSSKQKIDSSSSLSRKISKQSNEDIQNKENNPNPQGSSNSLQAPQVYQQELIINSLASIDKQNSKTELPIINEQTEYEEDMSRQNIVSDKGIRPLGIKSNTPKSSLKMGINKETSSVSSILCTSDEDDKQYPLQQNYCPSTPNIDISHNTQNEARKSQMVQLGQIIEENETSKNPSKDDKNLTTNEIEKDSSEMRYESLGDLIEESYSKSSKQHSPKIITQSIKSLNQQQLVIEDEIVSQDQQSNKFQEFSSISPQTNNQKIFQYPKVEEESNEKFSNPSFNSTKQIEQHQDNNTQSSLGDCKDASNKMQDKSQSNNNQSQNLPSQPYRSSKSGTQEDKKYSGDQENQSSSQGYDESLLYQQISPLPDIFEKEFKEISNSIYSQNIHKQTSNFSGKNGIENNNYQFQQDSLIFQQDNEDQNLQNFHNSKGHPHSKHSSLVNSPDMRTHKKKYTLKDDLQEKFSILQKSLKNNEILNEIESEFSSASGKNNNPNSSKDLKNKSNNIRLQLNRLASLEVTNVSSPFKVYQQYITANSEDKLSNSQNASRSSLKDEVMSKQPTATNSKQQIEEHFSFSQFNPILHQSSNSSHPQALPQQLSLHSQLDKNSKITQNNESIVELEKEKSSESTNQLKHIYPVSLRQRIISNPNPSQLAYQRDNNSTSPSSSGSVNGDIKQQNSISFTQFKEVGAHDEKRKSLTKNTKKYGSPLKNKTSQNLTPKNKDSKLVIDIVKLSNNFELKIKQHQLKSNHICLRIFELIQQLSKMFFIQDFQNNWKRKRMILDDNKQKIEFLLQKSMIPKDYATKITSILHTFAHRVELLEKLQNVEKQLSKQVDDIYEEIEKTEDNLSNDSGVTKQSNIPTNKIINKKNSIRQPFKSGTHISSRTQLSKDSYIIESPTTQSDQQSQSNPSNNNINSQNANTQFPSPIKNNFFFANQIFNNEPGQSNSTKQSPQKQEQKKFGNQIDDFDVNPRFKERAASNPTAPTLNDFADTIVTAGQNQENTVNGQMKSADDKNKSQPLLQQPPSNNLLSNNKRRMSVQSSLTLDIKNKIVQKINQQLSEEKKRSPLFKEDSLKTLSTYEKFDVIMKQAMQKFESDLVNFEKPLQYNNGYFSDGNVENCYQCLENIVKKESNHQINIQDFEFLTIISKGAFGRVWLVKKKNTDNVYAMKIVNLAEKMNKNNLMSLQNERDIFGIVSGDFVVKAVYTFAHESYLCFVMEYMIGGDLGAIMQQYGVLDETVAKFYIAEIILACSQLHKAGIVHRDLKPDNLLLDSKGHLKLTDFGLSDMGMKSRNMEGTKQKKFRQDFNNLKRGMDRISNLKGADKIFSSATPQTKSEKTRELKQMKTNLDVMLNKGTMSKKMKNKKKFRIIGTPDYIPPEVIKGSNNLNSPTLDWWSVGVILFEMLVGIPPFNDETVEKIFDNIVNMRVPWDQINIGYGEDEVSPEAEDLIKKLMDPNVATRLGVNGVAEIQQHKFFTNFDWSNVREMNAPVIPKVKNILDTSNFDKQIEYSDKEKIDPFYGLSKGEDEVNKAKDILKGYNFQMKRFDILYEENCQQLEEIQKKMKYMEEEIIKDEEELEKLEVEYGSDDGDSQDPQPFNIPKSVVTFQDLEQINNNSQILTFPRINNADIDESYSLRNIVDNSSGSYPNSNKLLNQQSEIQSKQEVNKIQESELEHMVSTNSIDANEQNFKNL